MNTNQIFLTVTAATALLISGCSKESTPGANESAPAASAPVTNVSNLSTTTVVKAASANSEAPVQALAAITNTVAATNVAATNATAAVNDAQSVLSNAMALVSQKKYTEAGTALASLKNQNLSAEQQSLWQKLQAEVQKSLTAKTASDGTKALGGLLGK